MIDALDEDNSILQKFKSSGRIKWIEKHAFFADPVADLPIFRIPQRRGVSVYVGEVFKQKVERSGLVGVSFELVWGKL